MAEKRKTYYDFIDEAQKPIAERSEVVDGRKGKRAIRRHHLDLDDQKALLARMKKERRFISPYQASGSYWGITQALGLLGENKFHPISEVFRAMEEVMSSKETIDKAGRTAWERFKNKSPRSKKTGLDWFGRIVQNLSVLQRIGGDDPYGLKLCQIGACIDLKADEHGAPLVQLRTGIPRGEHIIPLNTLKGRKCSRSVESIPSQISFSPAPASSNGRRGSEETDEVSETVSVSEKSG